MLEIPALILLSRYIGKLAERKGEQKTRWKIRFILYWFGLEFLGMFVGLLLFDPQSNLFSIMMVMLMFAVTGFFLVRKKLEQLPDKNSLEDDIEEIGS